MIKTCVEIENKHVSVDQRIRAGFKVYPKLHNLVHYGSEIRKFFHPKTTSMLPIERGHQTFKIKSRLMNNYKNCPFSFAKMAALLMTQSLKKMVRLDLSAASQNEDENVSYLNFQDHLPIDAVKLPKSKYPQKISSGNILKKFMITRECSRIEMWFKLTCFHLQSSTKSIYASGHVYEVERAVQVGNQVSTVYKRIRLKATSEKIVKIHFLSHKNDLLFTCSSGNLYVIESF